MENITQKEFFHMELNAKKEKGWFIFRGFVDGVYIEIKQIRGSDIYQQILRAGDKLTDYSAGHTLRTVGEFKSQISSLLQSKK